MFFLARWIGAIQEQELGSEQTDALSAGFQRLVRVGSRGQIGYDLDLLSVVCARLALGRGESDPPGRNSGRSLRSNASPVAASGSRITALALPSIATGMPEARSVNASCPRPTTAGIPMPRARMAVCAVGPLSAVQKPATLLRSSEAVCEGARSSAMITALSGKQRVFLFRRANSE